MHPLVAAAADRTGLTITLLSIGLLAIALMLTVLSVWYWRFTRPGPAEVDRVVVDRLATGPVATDRPFRLTEPPPPGPVGADRPFRCTEPAPVEPGADGARTTTTPSFAAAVLVDDGVVEDDAVTVDAKIAENAGGEAALDDDQWAVLTRSVFERYLESPENEDGASSGNAAGPGRG